MSPILFSQDGQLTSMAANTPLNFNQDHIANYQPSSLAPKSFMFHTTLSEISHPPTNTSVNFNNDFSLGQTSSLNFAANPIPPGSSVRCHTKPYRRQTPSTLFNIQWVHQHTLLSRQQCTSLHRTLKVHPMSIWIWISSHPPSLTRYVD